MVGGPGVAPGDITLTRISLVAQASVAGFATLFAHMCKRQAVHVEVT